MRRTLALIPLAVALALPAAPAHASLTCGDLGPVPGYGPVCTVECLLGGRHTVDPKDVQGTVRSFVPYCYA